MEDGGARGGGGGKTEREERGRRGGRRGGGPGGRGKGSRKAGTTLHEAVGATGGSERRVGPAHPKGGGTTQKCRSRPGDRWLERRMSAKGTDLTHSLRCRHTLLSPDPTHRQPRQAQAIAKLVPVLQQASLCSRGRPGPPFAHEGGPEHHLCGACQKTIREISTLWLFSQHNKFWQMHIMISNKKLT